MAASVETRAAEIAEKERRIRRYLAEHGLGAVLLTTPASVAWATGGGSSGAADLGTGGAALLYTAAEKLLIAPNGERERILAEEIEGLGYGSAGYPWYEPDLAGTARQLTAGRIGADAAVPGTEPLAADFAALRYSLTPGEAARYRELGLRMGLAMTQACYEVRPGLSEQHIGGILAGNLCALGIAPVALLIATDDRADRFRQPLPTGRRLERLAMLAVAGRQGGLTASMARLVHFGDLPADLRRRHNAAARVSAALMAATRSGARVADIFQAGLRAYAGAGFADEWRHHHQGGATGYETYDYLATAHTNAVVQLFQAFAWNPTIADTRCEDTILATNAGPEPLTLTPDRPSLAVECDGEAIARPDIVTR